MVLLQQQHRVLQLLLHDILDASFRAHEGPETPALSGPHRHAGVALIGPSGK